MITVHEGGLWILRLCDFALTLVPETFYSCCNSVHSVFPTMQFIELLSQIRVPEKYQVIGGCG